MGLSDWLFGKRRVSESRQPAATIPFEPRHGATLDIYSLCARYTFGYGDLQRAWFPMGTRLTEIWKAVLHERYHVSQMLSTPYGYYYLSVRNMQVALATKLLAALGEVAPRKIKPPLIELMRDESLAKSAPMIAQYLGFFHNTELWLSFLQGDSQRYVEMERAEKIGIQGLKWRFLRNEEVFVPYLRSRNLSFDYPGPGIDDTEKPWPDEQAAMVFSALGQLNVSALLESAAHIAEYWNHEHLANGSVEPIQWDNEWRNWYASERPSVKEQAHYSYLPRVAEDRLPRVSGCNEFVYTYMAICDWALFAPLLPFHHGLRSHNTRFGDFYPLLIAHKLLQAAHDVEPIRDPARDYERFVREVAKAAGVPTPMEYAEATVESIRPPQGDHLTLAFHAAQSLRAAAPWTFLDLRLPFADANSDVITSIQAIYTHPVMQFSDTILYHKNKELALFYITKFLLRAYTRRLVYEKDIVVQLPYRQTRAEITTMTRMLRGVLDEVSKHAPDPVIVSAK